MNLIHWILKTLLYVESLIRLKFYALKVLKLQNWREVNPSNKFKIKINLPTHDTVVPGKDPT